jgi:hypothetical protein
MPRKPKTWAEKMKAKPPHAVRLAQDFAGVPTGALLWISSPQEIAEFVTRLPKGRSMAVQEMRRQLAQQHQADATCPVSTAIFLRTVTEYAFEQYQAGVALDQLPPVWRVIEPGAKVLRKLSFDTQWLMICREQEGLSVST